MTRLGEEIRRRRKLLGYSQALLAERAGLTEKHVSRLELGVDGRHPDPSLKTAHALARALHCSLDDLVCVPFASHTSAKPQDLMTELCEACRGLSPEQVRLLFLVAHGLRRRRARTAIRSGLRTNKLTPERKEER